MKADEAHDVFVEHLRSVRVASEVAESFEQMFADALAQEGARWRKEEGRLWRQRREVEARLLRTDEAYVEGWIEADSYARLKERYAGERDQVEAALARCAGFGAVQGSG